MNEFHILGELTPLFDLIPEIQFWVKDRDSRFQACNASFVAHFGLSSFREIEGRTDFDVSPQPLAREYVQDDKTVLSSGKPMVEKLELVRERDGELKWYATTKIPLRNSQRLVFGTAGITRMVKSSIEGVTQLRGMDQAISKINTQYDQDLKIPSLASLAGMSVDNFERKFRMMFRETPLKYLNRIRMRAACSLLIHTNLSVGEITRQCGYSDQSYFTKRFYIHFHIRPLEYRRKYQSTAQDPAALRTTEGLQRI